MVGIYKIENPKGKIYIGQSRNIKKRQATYKRLFCTKQPKLYNSLKLYSWSDHLFSILHELPSDVTQDTLNAYETFYVDQFKATGHEMLNIKEPGSNGKHSEQTRKNMIESRKYHGITGRKLAADIIERRQATRQINGGYQFTEERNQRMAESLRGRKQTKEHIENTRQGRLKKKIGCRSVKSPELDIVFDSIKQAAEYFKCSREVVYGKIKRGELISTQLFIRNINHTNQII